MTLEDQLAAYRAKKAEEKERSDSKSKLSASNLFQFINLRSRGGNTTQNVLKTEDNAGDNIHENPGGEGSTQEHSPPRTIDRPVNWHVPPNSTTGPSNYTNRQYGEPSTTLLGRLLHNQYFTLKGTTILKCLLWLVLWGLFIEIQFGSVYFILSLFYFVYSSMRAGSRDRSQLSAYSVFNPNFETLEGTFTAEQFEKELKYGAGSVH